MSAIVHAITEVDDVAGEDSQRVLVVARRHLREAGRILRINARSPDAPGYFEVERAHNALFVVVDALVAELPPRTLLELQPPTMEGALVVRRTDLAGKVEALERRLYATEQQSRAARDLAERPRVVVSLIYVENLTARLGNLVKIAMSLSAELKATLIDLPWLAELTKRFGEVVSALGGALDALRRAGSAVTDIVRSAEKARAFGERVVSGARTLLRWVRRVLSARSGDRALPPGHIFRDVDAPWCPEMVVIPAGRFVMGSPVDEDGREGDEGPQHEVTLGQPFALGRYTVTFAEYDAFCAATGHRHAKDVWDRGRQPVILVSWDDATAYCRWLAERTGKPFRLPSEAEWEYACRAGTTTAFWTGATTSPNEANFNGNYGEGDGRKGIYRQRTVPVDDPAFRPNSFRLMHMHGNVSEWVEDRWHDSYDGAPLDGSPWTAGDDLRRVLRGGSWDGNPRDLRSAARSRSKLTNRLYDTGFRVARMLTS